MSDAKVLNNLDLENRKNELQKIIKLHKAFGKSSFDLVEKYNVSAGFCTGYARIVRMGENNDLNKDKFYNDPVQIISDFLFRYFKERGGNLPEVWTEGNTIYLKTEFDTSCITYEAENLLDVPHREICNVYCRSFVKGMLSVFPELFPGIKINFFNKSSRRDGDDCVEGFQIVYP